MRNERGRAGWKCNGRRKKASLAMSRGEGEGTRARKVTNEGER